MSPLVNKILIYLFLAAGLIWGLRLRLAGQTASETDTWIIFGCFAVAAFLSVAYRFGGNRKD